MDNNPTQKLKSVTKLYLFLGVGLLFCVSIFAADIYFDSKSGEKALQLCGEGNVKSVSTKGYFKREVDCKSVE